MTCTQVTGVALDLVRFGMLLLVLASPLKRRPCTTTMSLPCPSEKGSKEEVVVVFIAIIVVFVVVVVVVVVVVGAREKVSRISLELVQSVSIHTSCGPCL